VYLLTRAARAFGDGPVATRMPAIIGFWVMLLCLYRFVGRRCGPLYGWAALLLPLATWAYPYAYEARPYCVGIGLVGVALVCWQSATEGDRRPLALAGLALSLTAALCSHYYAVLLFAPLFFGEFVRTRARRRFDPWTVLALVIALLPLVVLVPLSAQGRQFASTHHEQPRWPLLHDFYVDLLGRSVLPLLALLVVTALYLRTGPTRRTAGGDEVEGQPPLYEIAVVVGLMLLPLLGTAIAKLGGGAFGHRYALSAVAGVTILLVYVAHRLTRGSLVLGATAVVVLFGWFLFIEMGE